MVRVVPLLFLLLPTLGVAQTPFVDGPFPTSSMDDDPNLIIVRERYDATKRIQSIYLRMADGTDDYEVTSGELFFTNAEMVTLITEREALKDGDANWGIPGVQYGRNRGLEGLDPSTHIPIEDSELDVARIQENSVRFWFGCGRDIDDFRILIRYPKENITSSLRLVLYHRRGADVEGWPRSNDGGLQIGSVEDVVPDDGLYPNEVFSIERLKLRVEDVDIVESEVDLGTVNFVGGAVGPGVMTIENQYRGTDPDADNGRDQNGDISPIPATGPLSHLRYEVQPLTGPDGVIIPASGIQVLGLPRQLGHGEQGLGQISVDTPADLPEGRYSGLITLWEDNNDDGIVNIEEPTDQVTVVVEVSDRVDAAPDIGPVDAGIDAELDAEIDAEIDSDVPDQWLLDLSFDAAEDAESDSSNPEKDMRAGQRDIAFSDALPDGTNGDSDVHPDGAAWDADSSEAADMADGMDVVRLDLGDPGQPHDWPGVPQGGALMCMSTDFSPFSILFFLVITPFLRRRR